MQPFVSESNDIPLEWWNHMFKIVCFFVIIVVLLLVKNLTPSASLHHPDSRTISRRRRFSPCWTTVCCLRAMSPAMWLAQSVFSDHRTVQPGLCIGLHTALSQLALLHTLCCSNRLPQKLVVVLYLTLYSVVFLISWHPRVSKKEGQ